MDVSVTPVLVPILALKAPEATDTVTVKLAVSTSVTAKAPPLKAKLICSVALNGSTNGVIVGASFTLVTLIVRVAIFDTPATLVSSSIVTLKTRAVVLGFSEALLYVN